MGGIISIQNKLEILAGGVISVPGCEPTTSMTSDTLSREMHCNASVIPVEDVLKLIPGSRIVTALRPSGTSSTGKYLELPAGPPRAGNTCPADCMPDWYAILRAHARVRQVQGEEQLIAGECASIFNFTGCPHTSDPILHPRNQPSILPLEVL